MFKLYELITNISCITKPSKKVSRGFNVAYDNPEENLDFLLLVAKQNFKWYTISSKECISVSSVENANKLAMMNFMKCIYL